MMIKNVLPHWNFDAKLRYALLASPRSAFFSEIIVDNLLVTLPAGVKNKKQHREFLRWFQLQENLYHKIVLIFFQKFIFINNYCTFFCYLQWRLQMTLIWRAARKIKRIIRQKSSCRLWDFFWARRVVLHFFGLCMAHALVRFYQSQKVAT